MALSGLHVACCFAGNLGPRDSEMPVVSTPVWSQTMASANTTTNAAPYPGGPETPARAGSPIFRVTASADSWVAFGPTPDASGAKRHYIQAFTEYDFAVETGDKLAWITA